ncbi:hypothetical protein ACFFX1_14730 [Dactylosporangium sucinum]|uniref:hypothetical protein n=1 Tax=Dactylosporangium sucinum TaxID=1424081 RepID=UPI00167D6011|nr:hypothetical protein [Dactylosporangium sucinum]
MGTPELIDKGTHVLAVRPDGEVLAAAVRSPEGTRWSVMVVGGGVGRQVESKEAAVAELKKLDA